MNNPKYCQRCGQPVPGNALVCPSCGMPAEGVTFFAPDQESSVAGGRARRGIVYWIGLLAMIGGIITSCLSVSVIALHYLGVFGSPVPSNPTAAPVASQSEPLAAIVSTQTPIPQPTNTAPEALPSATPVQSAQTVPADQPAPPATASQSGMYMEDFSNVNSGWNRRYEDAYNEDYAPDGNYRIELKLAEDMAVAVPPYPFQHPINNMIVSVNARGEVGNGFIGVLCHLQDGKSFYRAGIANGYYTVNKVIDGQLTHLTDPVWKPMIAYDPDPDGSVKITLACMDGRIQLMIDDIGQEIITDTDLTEGDAAIFVWAGTQPDDEGVYMRGYFDDFSVELP